MIAMCGKNCFGICRSATRILPIYIYNETTSFYLNESTDFMDSDNRLGIQAQTVAMNFKKVNYLDTKIAHIWSLRRLTATFTRFARFTP